MNEDNLYELADNIISQSVHTDDDIVALARIKRRLSRLVKEYDILSNWLEEEYNKARGSFYVEIKRKYKDDWRRITDSEADRYAKDRSEELYWSYRSAKAKTRGMYWEIEAIGQFIITLQSSRKANQQSQNTIDLSLIHE